MPGRAFWLEISRGLVANMGEASIHLSEASFPRATDLADNQECHPGKVLVVEDMALIRLTTMEMVELLGFAVEGAANATQALAQLKQDDEITVLLTDLGLPGMDGRQLTEEALRLNPALKVIIASGYSTKGDAFPSGTSYLQKPFDMQQLDRALKS